MTVVAAYYGGWKSPPEPIVTWQGSSPWGVDASDNVFMGNFPERFPDYGAVDEDQPVLMTDIPGSLRQNTFNVIRGY